MTKTHIDPIGSGGYMTEEKAAFMAAVVDNPAIIGEASSYPQAEEAVFRLCAETPDINFPEVLDNTHFGGLLLEIVAMRLRGTEYWKRFVDTLVESDRTLWSVRRDSISTPFSIHHLERTLAQCAEPRELFRYLLERHPTVWTNHPIGDILGRSADIFWKAEFQRRILHSDFRRAWETINHARLGLGLHQQKILVASLDTIKEMVEELHRRMRNRKLLAEVSAADYSSVAAYDNKIPIIGRHGHRRKPKVSQSHHIPGAEVAEYLKPCSPEGFNASESFAQKAALDIGHYFAKKRNEKRRKKYARLLRQFQKEV